MNTEIISKKLMIATMTCFVLGSSIVSGGSTVLIQDSWVSVITGALLAIPMVLVYARIVKLYPEKDIYEVFLELFGKIGGRIFIVMFTWYAWHLGALVLRDFSEYIQSTVKQDTPQVIVMLSIIVVAVYLVRSGMRTIGRWSIIVLVVILLVVITTIILGVINGRIENLYPLFNHKPLEFLSDAFLMFSFPYAETVLFLTVSNSLKKDESPYRVFIYGIAFGATILLFVSLRNIVLLGQEMVRSSLFPSFVAIRIIGLGKFLTKIEGIVMLNFILLGIAKITITLLAATKGVASLFNIRNYKDFTIPIAILMVVLGMIVYDNIINLVDFLAIYPIYAIPFQIVIPLVVWIFAEIKFRKTKIKKKGVNAVLIKNSKVYYKVVSDLKI